jgi:predicted Zn-dependent protease with MMP-like domain
VTNEDFEIVVRQTIEELPEEFQSQLDNVEIVIEDILDQQVGEKLTSSNTVLLGLYQGVPKTKRFSYSALPDKITIFKQPILFIAKDVDHAKKIIRETVLHELGHHFGLSDADLSEIEKRKRQNKP